MLPLDLPLIIIAFIGNVVLGLFTYSKNPKSTTNKLFLVFAGIISVYIIVNYLSLHQSTNEETHTWLNVLMSVVPFLNLSFFYLVLTFPQRKFPWTKEAFVVTWVITTIVALISLTGYTFISVEIKPSNIESTPGLGMPFFLLHTIFFLGGGFIILVKKFVRALGTERKQLGLFIAGTVFMYAATVTTSLLFVLFFNNSNFVGLLPLYTLIYVGCISYAIVRHRFLDINLLVVRTVTYAILIFIAAIMYSLGVIVVGTVFLDLNLTLAQQFTLISITVLIAMSFQRIQRFVEKLTRRFLYKESYNTDDAIGNLTKIMAFTLNLENLSQGLLQELKKTLKFTHAAFIILSKSGKPEFKQVQNAVSFDLGSEDVETICSLTSMTVFEELEEGQLKQLLRKYNLTIVAPLRTQEGTVGYLLLGMKESGDIYSEQDVAFIRILSDEAAVAIQNAKSYEEIQKFNITLQEEITKATRELKDANVKLQDLDKLKDEFVSLAAHELRTPMAAVKGSLSTILEGYAGDISIESREFLTAAYNENDRLIRLVNNLLNTTRIESGRLNFNVGRVNLTPLIADVVRNMQSATKEKDLYLTFEPDGSLPPVMADEDKIKEVVINLIGNGVKFTSKGGITIKTVVDGKFIKISVQDTGTGIHKEDFDLLFKKFSQVKRDEKYTKSFGGTGLGLYISQKIVEGLGGKIWLDSEVGKGTTFYFTLPIAG